MQNRLETKFFNLLIAVNESIIFENLTDDIAFDERKTYC